MNDIPVRTLIIANLRENHLIVGALVENSNYFLGLKSIRIEPKILHYPNDVHPFDAKNLGSLKQLCRKRNIELHRDAKPTFPYTRHRY